MRNTRPNLERETAGVARRYWFARADRLARPAYRQPLRARARLSIGSGVNAAQLVPQPIDWKGWLYVWAAAVAILIGALAAVMATSAAAPAVAIAWIVACVLVFGLLMNWLSDPDKPVEDYWLEQEERHARLAEGGLKK